MNLTLSLSLRQSVSALCIAGLLVLDLASTAHAQSPYTAQPALRLSLHQS